MPLHFERSCLLALPPLTALLTSCSGAKTTGAWNKDLSEEAPYVFSHDGASDAALASLKRTLLLKGVSVMGEDEYGEGGTYIFEKILSDDEKIESTAFFTAMTGASTGTQVGPLVSTASHSGGTTSVQMTPRLVATTQQYHKNGLSTEKEEFSLKQGNPLPMKYGRLFAEMDKWRLEEPERAAVFMEEGEEQASVQNEQREDKISRSKSPAASSPSASEETSSQRPAPQSGERPGDGGDDTAWVQQTLNELGMDCGTADGLMGPNTRECIRSFHKANGLDATGKVNEAIYETMLERR